eukprot:TRINITY_DN466_c1_g1_i1.p1 TRINITY_DN466_c1_g1~~TRINITY_DN466_c1_g1_i1.p1  ORF type:complete len:618 (-),score=115.57 TRINITY_DN466_c1_g1_i1:472-2325(-)
MARAVAAASTLTLAGAAPQMMAIASQGTSVAQQGLSQGGQQDYATAGDMGEHCIVWSTNYMPHLANVSHTMQTSHEACQISCALTHGCEFFAWDKYLMQCNYAGLDAKPQADYRYVSGKALCQPGEGAPAVMCKTDYPKDGFPALTREQSNAAWPLGHQPKGDECWPKRADGKPAQCKITTVVEDTIEGWPGVCWGLSEAQGVSETKCDTHCRDDSECAGYQTSGGKCMVGLGHDCYKREQDPGWKPTRAQRYQHGTVRVLMNLKGWQIQGLSKVFSAKADGFFGTDEAASDACKLSCYSKIDCQYWSYSTKYGCWVEDTTKWIVQWPLTLDKMNRDTVFAQTAIAGELIQHICEDPINATWQGEDVPFCALSGYRLDPLDLTQSTQEDNADLCQKKCYNTESCTYFSFNPKSGKCHLEGMNSLMVLDKNYVSGPQLCPVTTPGPQASCSLHPTCVEEGFEGICCPNQDGVVQSCCSATGIPSANNGNKRSAGGFGIAPEELEQPKPWIYYWWPMVLSIFVVLGCLGFFLWWARRKPVKRAQAAQMMHSGAPDAMSDSEVDPFASMNSMDSMSSVSLPFPEAGLPNRAVPFPEVMPGTFNGSMAGSQAGSRYDPNFS